LRFVLNFYSQSCLQVAACRRYWWGLIPVAYPRGAKTKLKKYAPVHFELTPSSTPRTHNLAHSAGHAFRSASHTRATKNGRDRFCCGFGPLSLPFTSRPAAMSFRTVVCRQMRAAAPTVLLLLLSQISQRISRERVFHTLGYRGAPAGHGSYCLRPSYLAGILWRALSR
jgi:hypothetical protein